jgi:tetratricopeptide (TPR) repeat protein
MASPLVSQRLRSACSGWRALPLVLLASLSGGCNQMNSQALNAEGVRLYQLGNYQQAADNFQRAVASDPKGATSYYNLAAALHKTGKLAGRQGDLAQAERLYNQCLEYDPNHAECYRGLAVLLSETGRQDAAFRLLEGWASRSPQLADPRIELARLLEESSNVEQASARLVEALAIDPHNSRALTALGRLREVSGDRAQALANYQRSLSVNRFQPEIAARVAALQAAGAGLPASPLITPQSDTRTAEQWQSTVRY